MSYLAYAGIGSRETPAQTIKVMRHVGAYLCSQGWTLRSGAAPGADSAFELGHNDQAFQDAAHPEKEIYLPWKGFNGSDSNLHPERIPFSDQEISLAKNTHPAWHHCSPSARRMHTRNVRQILGCEAVNGPTVTPVKFVICWTEGAKMKGGTAQALRIAQSCEIPIINLGFAKDAGELEKMVLQIDALQAQFKEQYA
ncbi:hypothetical protein [Mesorhizobium sp. M4B.F.Ca.ET.058.02.1.1]|uniref:hypothetical protein n=1 Tax=Mesorhizobium sp. M4B.F.Ca.ET.058.02.1.1 TaxID=2493675 RepID=UPI000F75FD27|nr:hypothetical protein [Mesorhizobium sp. M4B.F.Ca.ET.058.02.1.1]AZO48070.1 hypothetical protein EJ073_09755 [Mesorhizobium sp. M4B.F.Ca.ET.058.02.1.1]